MAKRFKLQICRMITNTLQSCHSRDPSNLPQDPPPPTNHRHVSMGEDLPLTLKPPEELKWWEEEKWHVVAKISNSRKLYNSSASASSSNTPPPSSAEKKKSRRRKKRSNIPTGLRVSTSSDEYETETLVSSSISCLSTDSSSDINYRRRRHQLLQPIRETRPFTSFNRMKSSNRSSLLAAEAEIPARLSMFKKLIPCTLEGKVKESFAVVKRSSDPYEDFKNSMMDMIVEKQMFEPRDLEQLLQCFLSLNSRHYHGIIVEAFTEIWKAIFSQATQGSSVLPAVEKKQLPFIVKMD